MGFVGDDSDSEAGGSTLSSQVDEEAILANGKESPFHDHRNSHCIFSPDGPHTPNTKNNGLLSITRLRRKGVTESEEIWEELEDDAFPGLTPFSRRKSSARSMPASKPPSRRDLIDEIPNESTALLARSGTGRSYRDRRRRRSTPILETQGRERKSASSQEALGGWWKMRDWWRGKERKNKGKGSSNGDGNGSGDSA